MSVNLDKIRGKAYESFMAQKEINYSEVERALPIVEDFIIKNKLILYGGMALDMAFKLKGQFIYDPADNVIPDYDFYSYDPIAHAYELADILHKAGFQKVNAINALHVTTMRVRLGSDAIADISYIPLNIFKNLPTLQYLDPKTKKTFTFINPIFQRIDLHEALTEPFRDPPHEPIFHRLKKDAKRFRMMDDLYPIEIKKPAKIILEKILVPNLGNDSLFVGYVSYAIHYQQLVELIDKVKNRKEIKSEFGHIQEMFEKIKPLEIKSKNKIIYIEKPVKEPISLYTDNYDMIMRTLKITDKSLQEKYYNTYLDRSRPRMVALHDMKTKNVKYEIFDNRRSIKTYIDVKIDGVKMKGASIHLTLMYFLQRYFEHKLDFCMDFYKSTLDIANLTEFILGLLPEPEKEMDKLTMFICKQFFGEYNLGDAFSVQMLYLTSNNKGERVDNLRARSYKPDEHDSHPPHDVLTMPPYQIDGLECPPFTPVGEGWYDKIQIKK